MTGPVPAPPRAFRAVLCDDQAEDCAHFRQLIPRHPAIHLVGEARTFPEALALVTSERADVLFLDAEVGGQFVLEDCSLVPPAVKLIFVTRNPAAAVRAFELDAVDFLLKPLISSRLSETIRRLLRIEWPRPSVPAPVAAATLLIPFERGRRGVTLDEISMIQAFGNYTRIALTGGRSEIVLRSLTKWEKLLPAPPFFRVHRNTIVNASTVRGLEEEEGGGSVLRLAGVDEGVAVSRRCLPEVRHRLFSPET